MAVTSGFVPGPNDTRATSKHAEKRDRRKPGNATLRCTRPTHSTSSPSSAARFYRVLDEEEILLKPTDMVIIQGINHGWSNRSEGPCLFTAVMIDAIPRQ